MEKLYDVVVVGAGKTNLANVCRIDETSRLNHGGGCFLFLMDN